MKFVFISDLHFGNGAYGGVEGDAPFDFEEHQEFAAKVHAELPDVLVLAGDCADPCIWGSFPRDVLKLYKNPHGESLCIPGNHDLWLPSPRRKTFMQAYEDFYTTAADEGWIGLRDKPWVKDGIYVVGNCCWYDFSAADPMFGKTPEMFDYEAQWSDYRMMGMLSALEFNKCLMAEFDKSISLVPPVDQRKRLIMVTHIAGFSFMLTGDFPRPDAGRSYMGNYSIGERVAKADADLYYCGHTHRRAEKMFGKTKCINNGSGYGRGSKRYDVLEF